MCMCVSRDCTSLGVLFLYESYFKIEFAKINVFKCIKMKLCARERIRLCARERIRLCARERIRLCAHARACVFVLIKKHTLEPFLAEALLADFFTEELLLLLGALSNDSGATLFAKIYA